MKTQKTTLFIFILAASVFLISGCSSGKEKKLWEKAQTTNTIDAYKEYIKAFPAGQFKKLADDKIQEIYYKDAEKNKSRVLEIFDQYFKEYPDGTYKGKFETIIYNEAVQKNNIDAFENYVVRFPQGTYVKEFENVIYKNIKDGASELSYLDFATTFPQSQYRDEVDDGIFKSLKASPVDTLIEKYLALFPEGRHLNDTKKLLEETVYKKAIEAGTNAEFKNFISKFPESKYIKKLTIESESAGLQFVVADKRKTNIISSQTPSSFDVLEGATIFISYEKEKNNPVSTEYQVTEAEDQKYRLTTQPTVQFIHSDNFDSESMWENSGNKRSFKVSDGSLVCTLKDLQYQLMNRFNIDFNKNFKIEIKIKFTKPTSDNLSYAGLVWGSEQNTSYFFISENGRYGYGKTESRYISGENTYGYSNWSPRPDANNKWFSAGNFARNQFNTISIQRKGDNLIYTLNGTNLFIDNILNTIKGSNVGIGAGSADFEIDYLRISQ